MDFKKKGHFKTLLELPVIRGYFHQSMAEKKKLDQNYHLCLSNCSRLTDFSDH